MGSHYEKLVLGGVILGLVFLGTSWKNSNSGSAPQVLVRSVKEESPANKEPEPIAEKAESIPASSVGTETGRGAVSSQEVRKAFYQKAGTPTPDFKGEIAIVADLENQEIYFDEEGGKVWPIASVTKLVTAAHARQRFSKDSQIFLSSQYFELVGGNNSRLFQAGEIYSLNDLIKGMLMFSANDAAEAVAGKVARNDFIDGMNETAKSWGMTETSFFDPTGLSSKNVSTAKDLMRLAKHIYEEYPDLLAISRASEDTLTELSSGNKIAVGNINTYAGKSYFIGGKTGYINDSGGNLLSIFRQNDRPVIVIVMGTGDRFVETEKLRIWFSENFSTSKDQ